MSLALALDHSPAGRMVLLGLVFVALKLLAFTLQVALSKGEYRHLPRTTFFRGLRHRQSHARSCCGIPVWCRPAQARSREYLVVCSAYARTHLPCGPRGPFAEAGEVFRAAAC